MCLLYMRCSTPVLFTCIAVSSHLVVKGGCTCENESLRRTTSYWVGQHKQERYIMGGS
jgi:hypothetical protein